MTEQIEFLARLEREQGELLGIEMIEALIEEFGLELRDAEVAVREFQYAESTRR